MKRYETEEFKKFLESDNFDSAEFSCRLCFFRNNGNKGKYKEMTCYNNNDDDCEKCLMDSIDFLREEI